MPETLRPAEPADAPRLAALARWVWLQTYADFGVRDSFVSYLDQAFGVETLAGLIADSARQRLWVIERGGHLRAWAHVDLAAACPRAGLAGPQAELCRLYVAPPAAGQGLGAALLRRLREELPAHALWLSAWDGNAGALRFYRREGAQLLGETWFELESERHRNEVLGWPALQHQQESKP